MDVSSEVSSGSFTTTGCDEIDRGWRDGRNYLDTNHSMTHWPCKRVIARKVSVKNSQTHSARRSCAKVKPRIIYKLR
jgi:hypothetical protein